MFRSVASIVCILAVFLSSNSYAFANDEPAENHGVQVYTDVVTENGYDESRAVTPYGYKALMLQNNKNGRKVACWICSSPCSAYYCCNDGYPQCCLVANRCMCCRV